MSQDWEIEVVFPQQGCALAKNRLKMNPECTVVLQPLQVSPNPVPGVLWRRDAPARDVGIRLTQSCRWVTHSFGKMWISRLCQAGRVSCTAGHGFEPLGHTKE